MAAVDEPTYTGLPQDEIERRYRLVREAAARDGLDAVLVCGNEYTGFEGAVTYLSGFVIVHRYAYVLLPVDGEPAIVFPSEARYVGEHGTTWIEQQEFVDRPGEWLAEEVRGKRVGVYGLDYVMTVRDYAALGGAAELVDWDVAFDHARMVKSELELASVRESVRINTEGFWVFLEHFEPGRPSARCSRRARSTSSRRAAAAGRWTWCSTGRTAQRCRSSRSPARASFAATDCVLPSLEVAGPGGHWVEVSRAICPGEPSDDTKRMLEAYDEYYAAAPAALRAGGSARDAHRAVAKGFLDRGFHLGHVTGHSIGMTMIEFPKIGEHDETELQAGMVLSMHPHAISQDGKACLYMQDTWLVTDDGGVPLADLPMKIFDGTERRPG